MSDYWKQFWKATGIRALRTFCQALVAAIGASAIFSDVDWKIALSTAGLAALVSVLTSISVGLPEVKMPTQGSEKSEENTDNYPKKGDE